MDYFNASIYCPRCNSATSIENYKSIIDNKTSLSSKEIKDFNRNIEILNMVSKTRKIRSSKTQRLSSLTNTIEFAFEFNNQKKKLICPKCGYECQNNRNKEEINCADIEIVDEGIAPTLEILGRKGYCIVYSNEGHSLSVPYLYFNTRDMSILKELVKEFPLPINWETGHQYFSRKGSDLDSVSDPDINAIYAMLELRSQSDTIPLGKDTEYKIEYMKACISIYEWAKSIPDASKYKLVRN